MLHDTDSGMVSALQVVGQLVETALEGPMKPSCNPLEHNNYNLRLGYILVLDT